MVDTSAGTPIIRQHNATSISGFWPSTMILVGQAVVPSNFTYDVRPAAPDKDLHDWPITLCQGLPETTAMTIDDQIQLGQQQRLGEELDDGEPAPDLFARRVKRWRQWGVLEVMISRVATTLRTDATTGCGGRSLIKRTKDLIDEVGLPSCGIPDSTRQLFAYLASGPNVDVDWADAATVREQSPRPAARDQRPAVDACVRVGTWCCWYAPGTARASFFRTAAQLTEFKRISGWPRPFEGRTRQSRLLWQGRQHHLERLSAPSPCPRR